MQHSFEWVQAAVGIIVALGMTRLVTSIVLLHSLRRSVRLDWVPVAWAINIFFLLLQFSWVFVALRGSVEQWTFGLFLCVLGFVLLLFAAAALVLPTTQAQAGDDLGSWFRSDGRWALPFLALYSLFAYVFNWYFGGESPTANPASAILLVLIAIGFFAKARRVNAWAAGICLALTAAIVLEMTMMG